MKKVWHVAEYGQKQDGTPEFFAIKDGGETVANLGVNGKHAALIAASPELLAALQKDLKRVEDLIQMIPNQAGMFDAWAKEIRAAIEAAGGRKA